MKRLLPMCAVSLIVIWLLVSHAIAIDLDWTIKKQLDLKGPTLDVSESKDGQWLFILTPGEILVYSAPEGRVINRIPVGKAFDRLIHFASNNTLILTSRSESTLKIIQLETIYTFDVSGLPFLGPEHAPVTLAVFGDYE
jgi:hypothetical protein